MRCYVDHLNITWFHSSLNWSISSKIFVASIFSELTTELKVMTTCMNKIRLSIIRVNWEIWCWPADVHCGHSSCATAVHFRPRGFALPLLVALPLVCLNPPHLLVHGGPLCLGKYTYSPLRISVWQVPVGGDPWEVAIVTSLYLHFAHTCSSPALLSIGTYPPMRLIYNWIHLHQLWM